MRAVWERAAERSAAPWHRADRASGARIRLACCRVLARERARHRAASERAAELRRLAEEAARILADRRDVRRVWLFGSLARVGRLVAEIRADRRALWAR